MNTPRTKKPKRWQHSIQNPVFGAYSMEIRDPEFLQALGAIVSAWPHVEEVMMLILSELLGVLMDETGIRQLYHSVINAKARIDIMRNLLEHSPRNASKTGEYDEIIDDFAKLNLKRNKFVHGLWSTHDTGKIFISPSGMDTMWIMTQAREVNIKELNGLLADMRKFTLKAQDIIQRDIKHKLDSKNLT